MRFLVKIVALFVCMTPPAMAQDLRIESNFLEDIGKPLANPPVPRPIPGATRYQCVFPRSGSDWIPKTVILDIRPNGQARVVDPVLNHFQQSPSMAKINRNSDSVLVARWRVRDVRDEDNRFAHHVEYGFRFNKTRGKASIDALPFLFRNRFNGRGSCEVQL